MNANISTNIKFVTVPAVETEAGLYVAGGVYQSVDVAEITEKKEDTILQANPQRYRDLLAWVIQSGNCEINNAVIPESTTENANALPTPTMELEVGRGAELNVAFDELPNELPDIELKPDAITDNTVELADLLSDDFGVDVSAITEQTSASELPALSTDVDFGDLLDSEPEFQPKEKKQRKSKKVYIPVTTGETNLLDSFAD